MFYSLKFYHSVVVSRNIGGFGLQSPIPRKGTAARSTHSEPSGIWHVSHNGDVFFLFK